MLRLRRRVGGQTVAAALVLLLAHAPMMKAIECYTATGYVQTLGHCRE